ncbi:phage tail tape measure protein [Marinovum sp.]|uniref:phage tail tape measure protein n=1 Tax=Marinovum sp. TaxID=2024839 RepID=UPI002B271B51|nr:phage tail tape measure protein [Marinovum sp.]
MAELDGLDDLDLQVDALAQSLGAAGSLAAGLDSELKRIHQTFSATGDQARALGTTLSGGLRKAIDGVILDGMNLSDALGVVGKSMINAAFNAAVKPVTDHFGALLGGVMNSAMPFEKGGAFSQGRVTPFATGGIVNGPVQFPMRGGMGLMGEAGPEAIMPLTRGPNGKLGVQAQGGGGGPINVVMNIQTPDAQGFQRSQSQIAAQMSRVLARGSRNR